MAGGDRPLTPKQALSRTSRRTLRKRFPSSPEQVPLMVLMVVVVVTILMAARTLSPPRHPHPHARVLAPKELLQTRWNLTCPAPNETEEEVMRVAVEEEEEEPLPADAVPCTERETPQRRERRGAFWVLPDYARALGRPRCLESVTLATHGDLTYLGNLGPLVRRWQAPVSLVLYAPGSDLEPTARAIAWARACVEPPLVAWHVSFHLLLDASHVPDTVPPPLDLSTQEQFDCSPEEAPWMKVPVAGTYRWQRGLRYPVNVARNVAREMARTHFVLVSDLELMPSVGLSYAFMAMARRKMSPDKLFTRQVFVLPIFEVQLGVQLPEKKSELVALLRFGKAAPFHERLCPHCHAIPRPQRWVCAPQRTDGALGTTAVAKRQGAFRGWEPIYIGTHHEPLYDERLSWEGMKDKKVQSYAMCLLDYRFYVLDDAFLVHQPGVKAANRDAWRSAIIRETNELIESTIKPELTKLYGSRDECFL